MIGDPVLQIVALLGWLVVAIAGFASFRLSWGKTLQYGLMWTGIFLGAYLLVSFLGLGG